MSINLETNILKGIDLEQMPETNALVPVQSDDVLSFTQSYKDKLRTSPEVEALTSEIHVEDLNTILAFGQKATEGISKVSDSLLSTMKAVKAEEAGEMIGQLTKVMDKFDIKDLETIKEPNMFQKLFNKAKNSVDAMFQKYESMGSEVDKIYIVLKKYELDIENSNKSLKMMYATNIEYYQKLEKYIVAGEMGLKELDTELIPRFEAEAAASGDQLAMADVQNLKRVRDMLEQRVYDLQIAENIALQTIPMLQGIQYSNYNLIRKINSAFIITLPIFKQCLTQAVMLKRQELQAKSLQALDDKTNELLLRNAENMSKQTTNIARLAGTSSIQIETLEKTWQTIMQGIEQTKEIEETNRLSRQSNAAKLESMKYDMIKKNTR
ncbi:MAG: toxic anion resistance family protein [Clostridia bacterium]|nr:toxic anion resistance family protein [Clostridia bacterium]